MKPDGIFTEAEELRIFRIADIVIERHSARCPNYLRLKAWAAGVAFGCGLAGITAGAVLKKLFGG